MATTRRRQKSTDKNQLKKATATATAIAMATATVTVTATVTACGGGGGSNDATTAAMATAKTMTVICGNSNNDCHIVAASSVVVIVLLSPSKPPLNLPRPHFVQIFVKQPINNMAALAATVVLGGGRSQKGRQTPPLSHQKWGSPPHLLSLLSSLL